MAVTGRVARYIADVSCFIEDTPYYIDAVIIAITDSVNWFVDWITQPSNVWGRRIFFGGLINPVLTGDLSLDDDLLIRYIKAEYGPFFNGEFGEFHKAAVLAIKSSREGRGLPDAPVSTSFLLNSLYDLTM